MPALDLTPEQEAEARRIAELVQKAGAEEILQIARLLVSKPDSQLLGPTEFQVRDRVHRIGAKALEIALAERKKGGTTDPVGPAPVAARRPSSSAGGPRRS